MECTVCKSEQETIHFDHLYTIGSEGTILCLDCRIHISKFLQSLMAVTTKVRIDTIKKYKRLRDIKD